MLWTDWLICCCLFCLLFCMQKPITCQESALQSWLWNCTKCQLTGMDQNLELAACVTWLTDRTTAWVTEWLQLMCTIELHIHTSTLHKREQVFFSFSNLNYHLVPCLWISAPLHSLFSLPVCHQTEKATLWLNQGATLAPWFPSFSLLSAVAASLDW